MAAAVTGWVTAVVLTLGGTAVAAATATPVWPPTSQTAGQVAQQAAAQVEARTGRSAAARTAPVASGDPAALASGPRRPPLPGEPVRRFEPPPHDYGPGHRGVDLAAAPGDVVVSPADGVVTFAGAVAGRGVVVVAHAGATLTSLEPVTAMVAVGTAVVTDEPVATVQASPRHVACPASAGVGCLHWGVRVDGRYVDPWWWLGRGGPVRLLPLDGA